MVLFQFPINDPRADPYDAAGHTRIMSSVSHNWSGRKVRVKVVGLYYYTNRAIAGWVAELMRIDFINTVMIDRPAIESGSTGLGGSSSQGFVFPNSPGSLQSLTVNFFPSVDQGRSDYYFDCLLQGPVLTIDILPMLYPPGARDITATTPFTFVDAFLHALVSLDVTLID